MMYSLTYPRKQHLCGRYTLLRHALRTLASGLISSKNQLESMHNCLPWPLQNMLTRTCKPECDYGVISLAAGPYLPGLPLLAVAESLRILGTSRWQKFASSSIEGHPGPAALGDARYTITFPLTQPRSNKKMCMHLHTTPFRWSLKIAAVAEHKGERLPPVLLFPFLLTLTKDCNCRLHPPSERVNLSAQRIFSSSFLCQKSAMRTEPTIN